MTDEANARRDTLSRTLWDVLAEGVVAVDAEGLIVDCNRAASDLLARASSDLVGTRIGEVLSALGERGESPAPLQPRGLASGELCLAAGGARYLELEVGEPDDGVQLVVLRDVTRQREIERELRGSKKMLQNVLDTIPVRVFWKDRDSVYLGCNRRFAEDAGRSRPEELIGDDDFNMGWRDQAELYRSDDAQVIRTGVEKVNYEEPQTTPTGDTIWLRTSKFPLRDIDGATIGVLATYEDITERKLAEEELERYRTQLEELVASRTHDLEEAQAKVIQSERLATLGRLTATVAHEIRNPLGTIRTCVFALSELRGSEPNERIERAVRLANRNVERCDRIIEELLDYSRRSDPELEPTELEAWTGAILDEFELPTGIECERALEGATTLSIDRERMRRAVINLLQNAAQAIQAAGSGQGTVRVTSTVTPRRWELRIDDDGCGMPDEVLQRVTEPLFSTKSFGVGLGVSVVEGVAREHGGGLEYRSRVGEGTTATVWLPTLTEEGGTP